MIKPVSLLSTGFALAALTAMQMPAAEPQAHQYEPTPQVSTQRVQFAEKAQITTLSATQAAHWLSRNAGSFKGLHFERIVPQRRYSCPSSH